MAESSIKDVNSLFQKQSVSEIEDVERQIRGDIEKKKQDLRVMVGERYRDLINAADTIQDMKKITGEVFSDIKAISDLCGSFGKNKSEESSSTTKKSNKVSEEAFYALATQMDLLVDTPEKIWSALDTRKFLAAAQFYLFSHHIVNSSLNIHAGQLKRGSRRDIFKSFPILHHQWAAISHFKPSILKGSRTALKDSTLPDQSIADSLCSIVLLEDYSPRQVFTEFLMARKTAFQDVFHPSFHATSVKKQVCDITHMLRLTIEQIITLFYTDENSGSSSQKPLFYKSLQEITDEKVVKKGKLFEDLFDNEVDVLTVSRYLPQSVTGFVPKLRSIPVSISVSYIQKHAVEWLNGCKGEIQQGIKSLLSFINNIKGLALIRDAVYELLKVSKNESNADDGDKGNDGNNVKLSWKDSCQICLNRSLSIWDEIFRPLFFERAKEILESQCSKCFENVMNSLNNTLAELADTNNAMTDTCWDHDYADFVWHEFPQDFQSNVQDSILALKVSSCTPSIKRLCDDTNNILKTILDDMRYFIGDDESEEGDENEVRLKNIRRDVQKLLLDQDDVFEETDEPFQRFSDTASIRELLNAAFNVGVNALCDNISSILTDTKQILKNADLKESSLINEQLDRAIYLSRFCMSIPEECDNIRKITEVDEKITKPPIKRQLSSNTKDTLYKAMKKTSSESLQRIHKLFHQQGDTAVSIWSGWLASMVSRLVKDTLQSHEEHFVFSTTSWEEVRIDEEGELGEKIKSSILVPTQPSFFLSSLLYRLSEEFHRIGGGMFERGAAQKLSVDIASAILEAHEGCMDQLKNPKTFQNKIFQIIFDLKFTNNLLCGNMDQKEQVVVGFRQRCKQFISSLEQLVDPFDLDVFMPHIDQFVNKQTSRSSLIYGCLSNIEKHNMQAQRTTSNEKANIVPLITNPPRFMLLPISSHVKDNAASSIEPFVGFDSTTRPLYQHQTHISLTGVV